MFVSPNVEARLYNTMLSSTLFTRPLLNVWPNRKNGLDLNLGNPILICKRKYGIGLETLGSVVSVSLYTEVR